MTEYTGILYFRGLGRIGKAAQVRMVLRLVVFAFLGLNLWYRFSTLFDYSLFVGGLFAGLAALSLVVVLFPGFLLRRCLFLFGFSFFMFGFRAYDIQSQVFETVVVFVAVVVFWVNWKGKGSEQGAGNRGQWLKSGWQGAEGGVSGVNRQLLGLILCYICLSALSLLLLPVGHMIKDFWLFGFKTSLMQMANATPNIYLYPLAGINQLILFFCWLMGLRRV